MKQDFSGVTEDGLALLFPIVLREHDPEWGALYRLEEGFLQSIFREKIVRASHIGSTAVPGLLAKPTVDILLEVAEDTELPAFTAIMEEYGYVVNTPEGDLILYLKGYTPQGFNGQAFHVHVRHSGDWGEPYFRDYLTAHPEVAEEYATLKLSLQKAYRNDRDGYTAAKGPFIQTCTARARAEFPGRYAPK